MPLCIYSPPERTAIFLSIWQLFCFILLPCNRLCFSYTPVQNSPVNTHKLLPCSQYSTEHKTTAVGHIHTNARVVYRMVGHYFYFAPNSRSQSFPENWVMTGWPELFHHLPTNLFTIIIIIRDTHTVSDLPHTAQAISQEGPNKGKKTPSLLGDILTGLYLWVSPESFHWIKSR